MTKPDWRQLLESMVANNCWFPEDSGRAITAALAEIDRLTEERDLLDSRLEGTVAPLRYASTRLPHLVDECTRLHDRVIELERSIVDATEKEGGDDA